MVTLAGLQEYYRGSRVFITGHTGFKGAWLMACLHLAGATIKGYALEDEHEEGIFRILSPLSGVDCCIADIRDKVRLKNELLAFQPDYVFHLAAQPLVRRSYEIPADTFEINVAGTASLLEAVNQVEKQCVVLVVTTDKVYENKETGALYREEDPLGGHDPYSTSKACAELVVDSFRKSFFNAAVQAGFGYQRAVASARAGNVIGGGDWSQDRIIPDIVRALQTGEKVQVRNPGSVRPWQHVLEPVCGYLQLAGRLYRAPETYAKSYNFGPLPEDHLMVRELVDIAIGRWGSGNWKDVSAPYAPHEAGVLKLDVSRARKELGWIPRLDAREAIQWTIDWYRQKRTGRAAFTFEQIKSYLSR
ncbi:MAG TPA: CDP-glucose 4,6-dehydratase [Puia sp.]|nr:CDP-glucose 4,6-dehydratase [Puia sp.]